MHLLAALIDDDGTAHTRPGYPVWRIMIGTGPVRDRTPYFPEVRVSPAPARHNFGDIEPSTLAAFFLGNVGDIAWPTVPSYTSDMNQTKLKDHMLILRCVVAGLLLIYLSFVLILVAAIGLTVGWTSATLVGFLVSAALSALIYFAAMPIATKTTSSSVARLYVLTLVRLASTLPIAQFGMFLSFALDTGITPGLLGIGGAILVLVVGVWPR